MANPKLIKERALRIHPRRARSISSRKMTLFSLHLVMARERTLVEHPIATSVSLAKATL
jgi:hypothetical protein